MHTIFRLLLALLALSATGHSHAQTLSIYCEEDRPLQFYDQDHQLTGLGVDVLQEIQKRVGNKDKIQVVPWSRGMSKLNHDPNTILMTMARTPEREALYQWIGPIASVEYALYGKADSELKIDNIEDAKKIHLIGVYRDDIRDQTLTRLGFNNLDRASSNISSFKKLMIASGYQVSDVKLIFPLFKSGLYFGVSKATNPTIVSKWNRALNDIKSDKTFLKIQRKYFTEQEILQQ
ncbi:MAG: transporter substrate-binding domain-containing protein [Burkholderiales bacterium]|nr:transporter substrate-binding domain-containing protein [Burkholderiales bacterium]